MVAFVLLLIPVALLLAAPLTGLLIHLGHRLGTLDTPGVAGQIKAPTRRIPNTGGIAIFLAIAIPILAGIVLMRVVATPSEPLGAHGATHLLKVLSEHVPGVAEQTPLALLLVGCLLVLHVMGLIDDRRPLGPFLKLVIMSLPALTIPIVTTFVPGYSSTRLLTFLDHDVGGPWLSIAITSLWFLVVTNAMNFMDNMDGLAAGVATVAGTLFLAAAVIHQQWFVGACLALLVGACLGFLVFNFPRPRGARIFMGDGGSLVLGFLLAFLTVRTTYLALPPSMSPMPTDPEATRTWYAVLMPVVVLAVPLYDFVSVVIIRIRQGKSPFVGDLQHLSHRLTNLGMSRRAAVCVIWGATAITGISGISLGSLQPWQAALVGVQVLTILGVLAAFEYASTKPPRREAGA